MENEIEDIHFMLDEIEVYLYDVEEPIVVKTSDFEEFCDKNNLIPCTWIYDLDGNPIPVVQHFDLFLLGSTPYSAIAKYLISKNIKNETVQEA